jgi:Family of unknown function (DUF5681)
MNQQENKTGPHRWQPGESGNIAGRRPGSRQKIAEALLKDIADVWSRRGGEVLEKLANDDPAALAKIAAGLLPRESLIDVRATALPGQLDPAEWARLRDVVALLDRLVPPNMSREQALAIAEGALRREFAQPLIELEVLAPVIPPCPVALPSGEVCSVGAGETE